MSTIHKIGSAVLDSVALSDYNNGVATVQTAKVPIKPITTEILEESFDEIQDSIATNAEAAVNGEFVKISDEYEKYWTDGKLKFVKHEETGTYQIQQLDENGNWVVMGYTTKEGYEKYNNRISEINNTSKETKESNETNKNDLEKKQHSLSASPPSNIKIEKTLENCISKKEDYIVPIDKFLVVPNSISNVLGGQVLKYNPETGKYHVYDNDSFSNISYDIEDLKNATERNNKF